MTLQEKYDALYADVKEALIRKILDSGQYSRFSIFPALRIDVRGYVEICLQFKSVMVIDERGYEYSLRTLTLEELIELVE